MRRLSIAKQEWDANLSQLLSNYRIYAPIKNGSGCDYQEINSELIPGVVYNEPKPVTPLKKFFLPVMENVTAEAAISKLTLIMGAPNCDVEALGILDQIYLDRAFPDEVYRKRRENTTILCTDCLSINDNCHCTSYGIEPRGNMKSDLSVIRMNGDMILSVYTKKGEEFLHSMNINGAPEPGPEMVDLLENKSQEVVGQLAHQNPGLPDYQLTGELVSHAGEKVWEKYSSDCVSCGACSAICPTCSCFLLVDRPGFEKVRQLDTCQYPGFERVAGGEDPLKELAERFRNRYMCKYVWKPEQYQERACTGCGRCIDCCIGQINKNELLISLKK
jgi:ferredoxin